MTNKHIELIEKTGRALKTNTSLLTDTSRFTAEESEDGKLISASEARYNLNTIEVMEYQLKDLKNEYKAILNEALEPIKGGTVITTGNTGIGRKG